MILIEEIKRKAIGSDIKNFYSSLPHNELGLQLLCVDATLSRGSLPLVEKYLKHQGFDSQHIVKKIEQLSDYNFYLSAEKIYDYVIEAVKKQSIDAVQILQFLKALAVSGELDRLLEQENTD